MAAAPRKNARARKDPKQAVLTREDMMPRLHAESLSLGGADGDEYFDFFPHMSANAVSDPLDKQAVLDLKAGTYMPYMNPLEYEGGWDDQYTEFSATLQPGPHALGAGGTSGTFTVAGDEAVAAAMRFHAHLRRLADGTVGLGVAAIQMPGTGGGAPLQSAERMRLEDLARMYINNRVPIRRKYYANPRQYYDHILLADAYANTFAGEVIDTFVDFVIGAGIYPVITLRRKTGDPEADKEALEEGQAAANDLMQIDAWYSDTGPEKQDDYFDVPFEDKLRDAITSMFVFGRVAIAKENWGHLPKVSIVEGDEDEGKSPDPKGTGGPFDPNGGGGNGGDDNAKPKPKEKNRNALGAAVDDDDDGKPPSKDALGKENGDKNKDGKETGELKEFPKLPNVLKVIHPIEMGLTEVELFTGKVAGVWISNDQPYLPADEMIYLVNSFNSPMIGTNTYGFTRLQRCIDHTRLYRRLIAKNFPQFLRTSASGMGAFIMNTTGYPQAVRDRIKQSMRNLYKTGEIAVIDYANVNDFEWKEFKINTDIEALVEVQQAMLSAISTILGVPHSIVFDNAESRATLIGRIVTYMATTIKSARRRLGMQLAQQWWLPNLRVLKEDDPEFLKKYTIEVRFAEMSLETKLEKVERLLQEIQLNPYKNSYLGEQLDDPDYQMHIDDAKIEEQNAKDDRMMEAQIMRAENGPPGAGGGGPPGKKGSPNSNSGPMDGARRSNSKNGRPIGTDRSTMKRRGSVSSG